ncbi:MAG: 50S ribosomal protein L2, partial [Nanoarchaeota archaeon]
MGKRIISQARGHGSLSYQVRKKAYIYKIKYPMATGEAEILDIIHSTAHSAPLIKVKVAQEIFYIPAFNGSIAGQKIKIGSTEMIPGNIVYLKDIPSTTQIYNLENNPGDGGKMIRT